MASLWEVDALQISALANAQYPQYTSNWQYIATSAAESDQDIHVNTALDASGTGNGVACGSGICSAPVLGEVVNRLSAQTSYIGSLNGTRAVMRGIFRFWDEHSGQRHFELHPMTEIFKWNGSSFVFDTDYRPNIKSVADGTGKALSTYVGLVNGSQTMTATVLSDNNRIAFSYPGGGSAGANYIQYDGVALSGLTNDFVSPYFWFRPTNSPAGAITGALPIRCRIVTNTVAATMAANLISNRTLTVNALNRDDLLSVSNTVALMTAGQSATFPRPVEFITMSVSNLGPVALPVALFTGSPTSGTEPLAVTFTDTSTGNITNRFWDFGDSSTTNVTTNSVVHTYAAGTNTVTLVVSGFGGISTNTKSSYIIVASSGPPPPVALFTGSPTNGTEPLAVTFTDTSTGTIGSRSWDFGDSGTTNVTTNSVVHTYSAGTNTVTLVVTGPGGVSTNTKPGYITVFTAFQSWQILYFGSTTNTAAAPDADPDGDGCNNLCEYLAGTDPTNSASNLHITSVTAQGPDLLITWATGLGRTNVVQSTPGLPNGSYSNNFTDVSPLIILPMGSGDFTTNYPDPGAATNFPARYYRIRLVP